MMQKSRYSPLSFVRGIALSVCLTAPTAFAGHIDADALIPLHLTEGIHSTGSSQGCADDPACEPLVKSQLQVWVEVFFDDPNPFGGPFDPSNPIPDPDVEANGQVVFTIGNAYSDGTPGGYWAGDWDDLGGGTPGDMYLKEFYLWDLGDILTFVGQVDEHTSAGVGFVHEGNGAFTMQGQGGIGSNDVNPLNPTTPNDLFAPQDPKAEYGGIAPPGGRDPVTLQVGERVSVAFDFYAINYTDLWPKVDQIYLGFVVQGVGDGEESGQFWTTMPLVDEAGEPVPEPSTLVLMFTGLAGVAVWSRRRR